MANKLDVSAQLIGGLAAQHAVTKRQLATFAIDHPACQALDDGELHLLAWLDANELLSKVMVLLSTADKAAIVATRLLFIAGFCHG